MVLFVTHLFGSSESYHGLQIVWSKIINHNNGLQHAMSCATVVQHRKFVYYSVLCIGGMSMDATSDIYVT
jgi:hypothetical protein